MINLCNDGGVYTITMTSDGNTICPDWQQQMLAILDQVETDCGEDTALVITGENKFFNNGINLDAVKKLNESDNKEFIRNLLEICRRILILPFPTVAAINGHAFAGGAFLAMSVDYRIMREDRGWICLSEVDVGVPINKPMMDILSAKLPPATVRDAVLTGKRYTADEAIAAGFVDSKAASEVLLDKALELATTLASKESGIFKELKQTLYKDLT